MLNAVDRRISKELYKMPDGSVIAARNYEEAYQIYTTNKIIKDDGNKNL